MAIEFEPRGDKNSIEVLGETKNEDLRGEMPDVHSIWGGHLGPAREILLNMTFKGS